MPASLHQWTTGNHARAAVILALTLAVAAHAVAEGRTPARVAAVPDTASAENLRRHVTSLAGEIGERNVYRPQQLRQAAAYLRAQWRAQGYTVSAQTYPLAGEQWANLEATLPGATRASEIVIIGAHYDSVAGSPGANDNGSGVAALLELTRLLARERPARTVRFVAFVNEEPPFFASREMGSRVYARAARSRDEDIRAMLSLETIGYYSNEPGSQRYPPFFRFFYPEQGNFIAFVANFASRALLRDTVAAFRAASDFPLEHVATFGWIPGVNWSDHGSFWHEDYPAIMVTDTAPYRYPYYHSKRDTPEKLDYPNLARVTGGLAAVVRALANPQ